MDVQNNDELVHKKEKDKSKDKQDTLTAIKGPQNSDVEQADSASTSSDKTGKPDDDHGKEASKKHKFHWFFWTLVVLLSCGIVVGFYYPSFYGDAYEYARYMTDKVMGKEPVPLRMAKPKIEIDNVTPADMPSNLEKTDKIDVSVSNEKPVNNDPIEDDTEIEEDEVDETLPDADFGIDTPQVRPEQKLEKTDAKSEQMPKVNMEEVANLKAALSLMHKGLKYQREMAILVKRSLDLRKAATSGKNFTRELEAFAKVNNINMKIEKDLATLAIFTKGIKSEHTLRKEFEPLAKKAMTLSYINENADFWDKTIASLKSMLIIRKTDGSDGGVVGTLTMAEKAVKAGKLAEAARIINNLPIKQREIFAKWCDDVMARGQVLQVTADIVDEAVNLMVIVPPEPDTTLLKQDKTDVTEPRNSVKGE